MTVPRAHTIRALNFEVPYQLASCRQHRITPGEAFAGVTARYPFCRRCISHQTQRMLYRAHITNTSRPVGQMPQVEPLVALKDGLIRLPNLSYHCCDGAGVVLYSGDCVDDGIHALIGLDVSRYFFGLVARQAEC